MGEIKMTKKLMNEALNELMKQDNIKRKIINKLLSELSLYKFGLDHFWERINYSTTKYAELYNECKKEIEEQEHA